MLNNLFLIFLSVRMILCVQKSSQLVQKQQQLNLLYINVNHLIKFHVRKKYLLSVVDMKNKFDVNLFCDSYLSFAAI